MSPWIRGVLDGGRNKGRGENKLGTLGLAWSLGWVFLMVAKIWMGIRSGLGHLFECSKSII